MDFELLFISVCVLRSISYMSSIYFLYVMIDIFDILIVFINSEKWRTIKRLCGDWYIYIYIYIWYVDCLVPVRFPHPSVVCHSAIVTLQIDYYVFNTSTLELCAIVLLLLYRLSNMVLCICAYLCNPCWYILVHGLTFSCW